MSFARKRLGELYDEAVFRLRIHRHREQEYQQQPPSIELCALLHAAYSRKLEPLCRIDEPVPHTAARQAVNVQDDQGYTALHYAIEACATPCCVRMLLEAGASASQRTRQGISALHLAVQRGLSQLIIVLLDHGRSALHRDFPSLSPVTNIKISRMLRDTSLSKHGIVMDIAEGREAMPIPAIYAQTAGAGDNPLGDFQYRSKMQEPLIRFSKESHTMPQACSCASGRCNPQRCPCLGTKDFEPSGKLKNDGKTTRIVRCCGPKCSCVIQGRPCASYLPCGVQHLIRLVQYPGKGWGVQTLQEIPVGSYICDYIGELVKYDYSRDGVERDNHSMSFVVHIQVKKHKFGVDGHRIGNVSRFMNHSCDPNCELRVIEQCGGTVTGKPRIVFFSKRHICALEELTWCYSQMSTGKIACLCGASCCKKWL